MGEYKKQHYVQAAHLESWADHDNKVYVCDLLNGHIYKGHPSSQAFEKYYYCFTNEKTGKKVFDIETSLFPDIEKALPIVKKLAVSTVITKQERNDIATYIAFQKTRTPFFEAMCNSTREKIDTEMIMKILDDQNRFDDFISDYESKHPSLERLPKREELIKDLSEGAFLFQYPREVSLQLMLQFVEPLAELYAQSKWAILQASKTRAFIISDNPAVTISFEGKEGGRESTETIFPLSPSACLLIEQNKSQTLSVLSEDSVGVREINRRLVLHAKRYVYSHSKELLEWSYKEYLKYQHAHKAISQNMPVAGVKDTTLFIKRVVSD